jgi:hypothetical protein
VPNHAISSVPLCLGRWPLHVPVADEIHEHKPGLRTGEVYKLRFLIPCGQKIRTVEKTVSCPFSA